jgi:hypothetical protein
MLYKRVVTLANCGPLVELAVEMRASLVLISVVAGKQLVDLRNEMSTKFNVPYCSDVRGICEGDYGLIGR